MEMMEGMKKPALKNPFAGMRPLSSNASPSALKKFVTGALFGGGNNKAASDKEFHKEVAKEVEAEKDLVWESHNDTPDGGEVVYTSQLKKKSKHQPQQHQYPPGGVGHAAHGRSQSITKTEGPYDSAWVSGNPLQ